MKGIYFQEVETEHFQPSTRGVNLMCSTCTLVNLMSTHTGVHYTSTVNLMCVNLLHLRLTEMSTMRRLGAPAPARGTAGAGG